METVSGKTSFVLVEEIKDGAVSFVVLEVTMLALKVYLILVLEEVISMVYL